MNESAFKKLKESLPFGAQADAAKKFNISPSAVSQIASGHTTNMDVLDYLIERARKYQQDKRKIQKEMEAL
jgi:hypothetical protein